MDVVEGGRGLPGPEGRESSFYKPWGNLKALTRCLPEGVRQGRISNAIELDWNAAAPMGDPATADLDRLDEFFTRWLPEIEKLLARSEEPWLPRIHLYVQRHAETRRGFRSERVRFVDTSVVRKYWTIFHSWHLAGGREAVDLHTAFSASYHLELKARLTKSFQPRRRVYLEAARVCEQAPFSRRIRRRALVLRALADMTAAQGELRRPRYDLDVAAQAYWTAYEKAQMAQEELFVADDQLPSYFEFWYHATRCRAAQVRGAVEDAFAAHEEATGLADRFREGVLFKFGAWTSSEDFLAEVHLIQALDYLLDDDPDPRAASEEVGQWLETTRSLRPTLRRTKIEIRKVALDLLVEAGRGADTVYTAERLRALAAQNPSVGRNTRRIVEACLAVSDAARRTKYRWRRMIASRAEREEAIFTLREFFPVDSLTDDSPARSEDVAKASLPVWFHAALGPGAADDVYELATVRYARIVCDYLWAIYERRSGEEQQAVVHVERPVFVTLEQVAGQLTKLEELLCPDGAYGATLRRLIELLEARITGSAARETFWAIVDDSVRELFPVLCRVDEIVVSSEAGKEGHLIGRFERLNPPEETVARLYSDETGRPGDMCYLKANQKAARGEMTAQLRLYAAAALAEPAPARLLCEGPSDKGALEVLLDAFEPGWRAALEVVAVRGDNVTNHVERYVDRPWVLVADGDKAYDREPRWRALWDRCCWHHLVEPNLELLNLRATWRTVMDTTGTFLAFDVVDELARSERDRFAEALADRLGVRTVKTPEFGQGLARRLLDARARTPLHFACIDALLLAHGFLPPCAVQDLARHDHHDADPRPWRNNRVPLTPGFDPWSVLGLMLPRKVTPAGG